ncbi:MAG TPA: NPCBM/NEW2 domain-containing protein [Phycisphaerae bacterium]|nr:NPCBM/NEW2 domain-containing protein [Phycisphaerae bacterium]HRY68929.1 NPCBM/NEW2 domain-containing protein [Phycisphaerae bacterium]HSA25756.1 NPCBM/NEW2 domain-containing protein [Phycisphaerae bacterium]
MRRRFLLGGASLVLACATGPTLAAGPAVQVITVEGKTVSGRWVGAGGDGSLRLVEGTQEFSLKADDVMVVTWPGAGGSRSAMRAGAGSQPSTMPAEGVELVIYLKDGSQLPARILAGGREGIEVAVALADRMKLSLSDLAGVRYVGSSSDEAVRAFGKALDRPDASQDALFIMGANNKMQTLRGTLESLDAKGGSFRWRDRSVAFAAQKACGLVMAAGVGGGPAAPARCMLDDGSILCGRITGGDVETIRLVMGGNKAVVVPVSRLMEIGFRGGRLVFLSDMEPAGYAFEPFGVTRWPYRYNRSVANRELRIGGRRFLRGIGMHSQAVLSYELKTGYDQLAATIGIDDGARPLGNAIFSVLADGKEVYRSEPVTGRDKAMDILVPIKGAKRLELKVDFGEEQDIGDHADWCDARLIK